MEKRNKKTKFLKNRTWRSKVAGRLRGRVDEICQFFATGELDSIHPLHLRKDQKQTHDKHSEVQDLGA